MSDRLCRRQAGADMKTALNLVCGEPSLQTFIPIQNGLTMPQQVAGLDRHVRVLPWSSALTCARRLPGRERFRRHPDSQVAALLQRPVILRPVLDAVACPGNPVTACFIELVGHQASGAGSAAPYTPPLPYPSPRTTDFCTNALTCVFADLGLPTPVARRLIPARLIPDPSLV